MTIGGPTSGPQRICAACVADLQVTGAGISFVTATGSRSVVHTTDDVAASVEDLQATLGEGPCVDADRTGRPVLVPDLDDSTDPVIGGWPAFAERASAVGVRALFAFPLRIGVVGIGVLDLYRARPGGLDPAKLAGALRAADAAAHALLALGPSPGSGPLADGGHDMRIHQATGMVKVQLGVSIDDAFLMLRARAFATGQSLSALAAEVVERRLRFSQEDQ